MMELLCIALVMVVTQIYTWVESHRIVPQRKNQFCYMLTSRLKSKTALEHLESQHL